MHASRVLHPPHPHFLHIDNELNKLTQARDYAAVERTFGSAIKLVIALTLVAGNYFYTAPFRAHKHLDVAIGAVLFFATIVFLAIVLHNYRMAVHNYHDNKRIVQAPIWFHVIFLCIAFFALAVTILEFIIRSS